MDLLLIPGFMLDADLWHDVEPALRRFGAIHHADLSQGATIADMARDALLAAPPTFIAVGFSMGGYVARQIVYQAPHRALALILIATSARGETEVQKRRRAALSVQQDGASFGKLGKAAVASSLHPGNADRSGLIVRIQAMSARLGADVYRRQSMLERYDETDHLGSIVCPTLIIAGAQDQLRSADESLALHHGIPGSSYTVIDNSGHMIPLEAPETLADVIGSWLVQALKIDASPE